MATRFSKRCAREMACAFTLGGKGYVGLGTRYNNDPGYSDFWCYDAEKDSWTRKDDYTGGGRWLNVAFFNENRAFVGPGALTFWSGFNDVWEFIEN